MTLIDWIPSTVITTIFGIILWLSRSLITTRLRSSVESEFNSKLENLKSDLRSKEAKIDILQNSAVSGLLTRQSLIYEKQASAAERIWDAVHELKKSSGIVAIMSALRFDECAKKAHSDPKIREVLEIMTPGFDLKDLKLKSESYKSRPYLSPIAWAYFSAYEAIILLAVVKFHSLKSGIENPQNYINSERVTKLAITAMPHMKDFIIKHGDDCLHLLLENLEEMILSELQNTLRGTNADKENTERAADILKQANDLAKEAHEGT